MIKKYHFKHILISLSCLLSPAIFAQGYGVAGRVLKDGEVPSPNAICQSYGYGNVLQTKCFDAEPNNGVRDTPQTAKNIDLKDTVDSATSGEHRTVYTYRDNYGIVHYTENVPEEYKKSSSVFKKSTTSSHEPVKMISYPKELAGPAVAPEHPSISSNFEEPVLRPDPGISSSGTRVSNSSRTKYTEKKTTKVSSSSKNSKKNASSSTVKTLKTSTSVKTSKSEKTEKSKSNSSKKKK